jgi:hypothetical protein
MASTDILSGRPVGTAIRCPRNSEDAERGDLGVEQPMPAPADRSTRLVTVSGSRPAPVGLGAALDELLRLQRPEFLPERVGALTRIDLIWMTACVRALTAGLPRGAQQPDRFHDPGALLRCHLRGPGEHDPGGGLGVERVGLAEMAPVGARGACDLDHLDTCGLHEPRHPGVVAAGPLDARAGHQLERTRSRQQLLVAGRDRGHADRAQRRPIPSSAAAACWSRWVCRCRA